MRISDWSSDVCSSDLMVRALDAQCWQKRAGQRAKTALHAVADNRPADLLGDGDAKTNGRVAIIAGTNKKHETGHRHALSGVGRQQVAPLSDLPQADSFLRPLARRAARTLRPPTVAARARKPWRRSRTRRLA